MKIVFLFILFPVVTIAYSQQAKNPDSVTCINYRWHTDVYDFELSLDSSAVTYKQKDLQYKKIIKSFSGEVGGWWDQIISSVKFIQLDKLDQLPAPTNYRGFDGAAYAKLYICTKTKVYKTQYFDSGFPMKEVFNLLYQINRLVSPIIIECGSASN